MPIEAHVIREALIQMFIKLNRLGIDYSVL